MMDEEDRDTRFAVSLVIALAIAICLFVIALATAAALGAFDKKKAPAVPVATAGTSALAADDSGAVRVSETLVSVYFAFAKSQLPANAQAVLAPLVEAQRAKGGKLVVSGYHDASGDAALNAELAKQRAFAVRDMLLAFGLGQQAIELSKPAVTMGGADARHARRVDVSLQ